MSHPPLLNPYLDLVQLLRTQPDDFQLKTRKKLIWSYSWAIPTPEVILKIKEYTPIIEIGSGTGYWAWLLRQAGAKIQCLDLEPDAPPRWVEIKRGDPSHLKLYQDHTLLLCWPSLNTHMATQSLNHFTGSHLIYVGEWRGRTADSEFHDQLENQWNLEHRISIPCWPGFSDHVFIFSRLKSA